MIRPAHAGDERHLAVAHITSWQHAYREQFPAEFLESLDLDRRAEWFETQIARGAGLLVAEDSGKPVGFSLIGDSGDDGWGELLAIYVHPDWWGAGHGHELMIASERELTSLGFDRAMLWVLESNQRARDFYERHGWALAKPIRLEDIGGRQVTELRYERALGGSARSAPRPRGM